ncbi:site-specific integrase [uncultured Sphingomonas sp.]|uniref:tyrosine-type recombinase/integrase n=1 Tax=uncultured Sphingomonas sp. TaxID=158754 RepID=UPI0025F96B55|nr:site-specific integrase [uncultured Sphingomonas sp.]
MAKAAITKRTVDEAQAGQRDYFMWDSGKESVPGLGLKVTPAGGKVYVLQYRIARKGLAARTAPKRYTIGRHGALTPDQARRRARELAAIIATGVDPKELEADRREERERIRQAANEAARMDRELAFAGYAERWLDHYENEKERRAASVKAARLAVNVYLTPALGDKPMPLIDRSHLQPIIDAIPYEKKATRRSVFAYASVLFGWASKRGDIAANPLSHMAKPEAPAARDRVMTDVELAAVWGATYSLGLPFAAMFRLLILTGQRRGEVAEMDWQELDREGRLWIVPADRAKNGAVHIVPLSCAAIKELDAVAGREDWPDRGPVLTTTGRTPISGITKAKRALDSAAAEKRNGRAIKPWRIHDLRRTLATGFQRLGVRFEVTEAVLNHISGSKGGVAGIYQRHDWKAEKGEALQAWSLKIMALTGE